MNLAIFINDELFQQALGHVHLCGKPDLPGFLIENHLTDLIAGLVEFLDRRLDGFGRWIGSRERVRPDERMVLRQCEGNAGRKKNQEVGEHGRG